MNDPFKEEKYDIQGHEFIKRYTGAGVTFHCDGREVDIFEWNRLLNENQPMSLLESHPNPLVRRKENHRRCSFVNFAGDLSGKTVADVGCEEGHLAELVAGSCAKLHCIDIDADVLGRARQRLAGADNVEFIASDVRKIELPDNSVDVCLASEILEHLPRPEEGIDELVRITKPGGRIVLSVPNEKLVLSIKKMARLVGMGRSLGRLSGGIAVGHVQVFSKRKIRELCEGRVRLESVRYSAPFFLNIYASGTPMKY